MAGLVARHIGTFATSEAQDHAVLAALQRHPATSDRDSATSDQDRPTSDQERRRRDGDCTASRDLQDRASAATGKAAQQVTVWACAEPSVQPNVPHMSLYRLYIGIAER